MFKRNKAFTLAEVLITLGIIGVVAAMTIPTLISNYQKTQCVSALKKAYTNLTQAVKSSEIDNGNCATWDWGDSITQRQSFDTYWAPYLKIIKYCNGPTDCGYNLPGDWIKTLRGNNGLYLGNTTVVTMVMLADGTMFAVRYNGGSGAIYVDVNGAKKPNVWGKDVFKFALDANKGFVPLGYSGSLSASDINSINLDCSTAGDGNDCATKIMMDGWQIKDDYPW